MTVVLSPDEVVDLTVMEPGDAIRCPTCEHTDRVYNRRIHHQQAEAMLAFYQQTRGRTDWFHKPTVLKTAGVTSRDDAMLRYWGLIEEQLTVDPENGEIGYWRLTPLGVAFCEGRLTVPRNAVVFRGEVVKFTGEQTNLSECLESHFDRTELYSA